MPITQISRRGWLQTGALLAGAPCACLAQATNDCCTVPEVPVDGVQFQPGLITIHLDRTPVLHRVGAAVKIVDSARKLHVIVAHSGKNRYVALDQKCTHGGGALTYVHRHQHLYCTCWGHAKFALDGSVLRWPNTQTPRPLRAHTVERKGNLLEIRVEGLA
jgi:nitrite reductase/ring-hydroxylating ferredoxin subunit